MKQLFRIGLVVAILLFILSILGIGFVFIATGGDVVDGVQTFILRLQLSGRQEELQQPIGTDETPIRFTVDPGTPPRSIAQNLFDNGLVVDSDLFVDYVRVEGLDTQLEAGTYFLNKTQNLMQVALMLTDSRNSSITFTIIEGWRLEEVAAAIDQTPLFGFTGADFLAATSGDNVFPSEITQVIGLPPGRSLEGFMLPETYILPPNITAVGLRDLLVNNLLEAVGSQLIADAQLDGYSLFNIITIASIVERESVWEDENSLIASVYRNRLRQGIPLQADPTVQYGLQGSRNQQWWPQITIADYQDVQSEYNTYVHPGLPPGPIANPGLATIRATAYPTESTFVYFRAKCDGSNYHEFAETFEEHLANACETSP